MPTGHKHLVRCRCVLPQFKQAQHPPVHQFITFSVVDDNNVVRIKYAQCPNCGVIHKVVDICRTEILQDREHMSSIVTVSEIKLSLPETLGTLLENNKADLPTWEAAQFIWENDKWGEFVVLSSETDADTKHGKYVRILGKNMFKVETFERKELV